MDWTCVYNRDVYLNGERIGYVDSDSEGVGILYVGNKVFCQIDSEGGFYRNGVKIGYIDDVGDVYFGGSLKGEIDSRNDIQLKAIG